jgi:isochorismate synthase EntC
MNFRIVAQSRPGHYWLGQSCAKKSDFVWIRQLFGDETPELVFVDGVEELSLNELLKRFSPTTESSWVPHWSEPDWDEFLTGIKDCQQLFALEKGVKAVARVVVSASVPESRIEADLLFQQLVRRVLSHPEPLETLFGIAESPMEWRLFPTPELLLKREGDEFETMALAGTRSLDRVDELLHDPKERREHQAVIDDIRAQLGKCHVKELQVLPTQVLKLKRLAHLYTPLRFRVDPARDFVSSTVEVIRTLHPTAALGVLPRSREMLDWLTRYGMPSSPFGAPMGWIHSKQRRASIGVSIRGLWCQEQRIHLGAGCGVLAESVPALEKQEIQRKMQSVLQRMGWAV